MMEVLFIKVAITSFVVVCLMGLLNSFLEYEDLEKGHKKTEVPAFVPVIGGTAVILTIASAITALMLYIWS